MSGEKNTGRILGGTVISVVVIALLYILDHSLGSAPPLGKFLDPVNGSLANAEPVNTNFNVGRKMAGLKGKATVWFDSMLIPHVHADNDHDLYFLEGYIHATFRLWQMDLETRAAAGRVSEVVGEKALSFDRKQRYKGMGYAAENSLRAMEADPRTKQMMDAYTDGVNSYISSLCYKTYPLEYKLMGFAPEPWTNLKISLLLKYMADDLTGKTDDIALTYLRDILPKGELDQLFPDKIQGCDPVIPIGTVFDKPSLQVPNAPPDSIVFPRFSTTDFGEKREDGKGSNSWAISGTRTASGVTILCNDPHLGLNLPSLWYQMQLQAPGINVYGVSLPGTPGIIIGFTDSISWGFTNNYRDVKDFYLIKPVEGNKNKYWFAGKQLDFAKRVERIAVKGKPDVIDTIDYTIHGPVTYAEQNAKNGSLARPLATCWMAYRPTNEMLSVYLLNRATNYDAFVNAIMHFECPAQNMAYADRAGNIAMWGQGQFVNKWKDQGKYVMEGRDSATLWKELIPMRENPHALNPAQGFLSSANQATTDSTYPYEYNGSGWVNLRAWRVNALLRGIQKATIQDMFTMQQDTYSELAAGALPVMLKNLSPEMAGKGQKYVDELTKWDYRLTAESEAGTVFQLWWENLTNAIWGEQFKNVPDHLLPLQERTMQLLQLGEVFPLIKLDQSRTPAYGEPISLSFKQTIDSIAKLDLKGTTAWYKVKNTTVAHLTKIPAFSYDHLKIGGWGNTINAAKGDHGPSWRMVVQMGKEIEAYGVYPGGQSGNPGSKFYASFLPSWVDGQYYRLMFLPNTDHQNDRSLKYTWTLTSKE